MRQNSSHRQALASNMGGQATVDITGSVGWKRGFASGAASEGRQRVFGIT